MFRKELKAEIFGDESTRNKGSFGLKTLKNIIIFSSSVVFIVMLCSKQSHAWGNTWLGIDLHKIVDSLAGRIGPFRLNSAIWLNNAGYDTDIYYGNTRNRVPDTFFIAGSSISLFLPFKNGIVFDVSENPEYVYYSQTKKDRALNNTFQGRLHLALNKFYFQVSGRLISAKQRIASELYLNVRYKENNFGGLAFWQISQGSAVTLQYRSSTYRYENSADQIFDWEALDRTDSFTSFTVLLQGLRRSRFFVEAEYGTFVFSRPASSYRDSRSFGINAGIEFLPPPIGREQDSGIQGTLNLGYKRFDVIDPDRKDFEGIVGNTGIAINLVKFTTIYGGYSRDIQFSVYSDLSYYILANYSAGISRTITRKMDFSYDLSIGQIDYIERDISTYEGGKRIIVGHSFRIGYTIKENLRLNLIAMIGERAEYYNEPVYNHSFFGFNLIYGHTTGDIGLHSSAGFR